MSFSRSLTKPCQRNLARRTPAHRLRPFCSAAIAKWPASARRASLAVPRGLRGKRHGPPDDDAWMRARSPTRRHRSRRRRRATIVAPCGRQRCTRVAIGGLLGQVIDPQGLKLHSAHTHPPARGRQQTSVHVSASSCGAMFAQRRRPETRSFN